MSYMFGFLFNLIDLFQYTQGDYFMFKCQHLTIKSHSEILVDDLSFDFEKSLAIIGHSGSGKSLTLRAILGLLPSSLSMSGSINFTNINDISFIPQNPFTSFSPMSKIKNHFEISLDKIKQLLAFVDLDFNLIDRFPSELSGGQLQRMMTALALEKTPKLILLDEITTSLDLENKHKVLDLIKMFQEKMGFLIIFVSHDIDSVRRICEDCLIISAGKKIEYGKMNDIINSPKSDYTKQLINSSFVNRKFRT